MTPPPAANRRPARGACEPGLPERPTIAHVLHRLDFAGAEVLAAQLSRAMRERYRFVFFVLDGVGPLGDRLRGEGFEVVELHRRPGVDRRVMRTLRGAARDHGVGLLHAHQYTPFFYAAAARGLRRRSSLPVLFTEHGRHTPDRRSRKRVLANRVLLAPRDRVTAVSAFVRQSLIDYEDIAPHRIETIHNGIAPDYPAQLSRNAARQALGIQDNAPLVLQPARLHPVKDHATALRAWQRVTQHLPDARLALIGDGEQHETLRQLASELGLGKSVVFAGTVPDARALLPAGDVVILSSLSEGLSVTLLEAMATGLPVVTTDVGGNPELVIHDQTGLLVPPREPEALADALLTLLKDAARRDTLGRAGRARMTELFTADRMHTAYARYYERMIPPLSPIQAGPERSAGPGRVG